MSKSTIYLTLDRRSHRIRITNEMLAYIGMPKYLQFLINPVEKVMLVRAIEQGAAKEQAYKVKHQPSNESYIEIHSKLLIDKFGDAFTEYENGKIYSAGGRVLGVTHVDETLKGAIDGAYAKVNKIKFDNAFYRHDIGARALLATEEK